MPSFLKDLTPFYGTGEKNAEGKTLEQFLEDYDPYKYRTPCCTTDTVVFSYNGQPVSEDTVFKVLLVKRKNHPSIAFLRPYSPRGSPNRNNSALSSIRHSLESRRQIL